MSVSNEAPAPPGAPPMPAAPPPLPAYAPMLAAYQRSHAADLRKMIADLPLPADPRVLDLACGAGIYTCWLAERVGPRGMVVGVDIDPAFLAEAATTVAAAGLADRVTLQRSDGARLPFDDGSFDLAWCAQSLYSLPEPRAALRELCRVTRPGGCVAVFENDIIHQVILPWPSDLELAVRAAQLRSYGGGRAQAKPFAIPRRLRAALREAGLSACRVAAYTSVRHAPLGPDERAFLGQYLEDLLRRTAPHLEAGPRARLERLVDPASGGYLLDDPDFFVTYIDLLAHGVKRAPAAGATPGTRHDERSQA